MSLDVYLELDAQQVPAHDKEPVVPVRIDGRSESLTLSEYEEMFPGRTPITVPSPDPHEVFHGNITHNLNKMADAADLYYPLWQPEKIDIKTAAQLIEPLSDGLEKLKSDPDRFRQLNPPNGWGNYEGLVTFTEEYLAACKNYPAAKVATWR